MKKYLSVGGVILGGLLFCSMASAEVKISTFLTVDPDFDVVNPVGNEVTTVYNDQTVYLFFRSDDLEMNQTVTLASYYYPVTEDGDVAKELKSSGPPLTLTVDRGCRENPPKVCGHFVLDVPGGVIPSGVHVFLLFVDYNEDPVAQVTFPVVPRGTDID